MDTFHSFADVLLSRLAWTSMQAIVLIGTVWLAGRVFPRLPAAARSTLWWLIGVQLILGLAIGTPVQLPLLPASPDAVSLTTASPQSAIARIASARASRPASAATLPLSPATAVSTTQPVFSLAFVRMHGPLALMCLWLAGVLVQLVLVARDWRRMRTVLRDTVPLHDPMLQSLCAEQVRVLKLRRTPTLRVSSDILSPQVMGLWRPTILLPASHDLTAHESSLALAHELTHLRRGDLWMSWIPAIAQRLFFFHPLVAWAVREYALSREAACDAQVLQHTGTMPQAYGRLLLRLGVAHPMSSGLAGASSSFQNLKRRLTMLQQTDNLPRQRARGWLLIGLIAAAGVLPYRVTASSPGHANVVQATADSSSATQNASSPPDAPLAPLAPLQPLPPLPPPPPSVATPPLPPPPPPPPPHPSGFNARHIDIDTTAHTEQGFALIDGDSVTINGSDSDVDAVKRLRQGNEPILWFRRGDKSYVVRDHTYIQRAKAIYAPVSELGRLQGALGGEQGRLGSLQGGLGARQGALGSQQGRLAGEQAKLAAEAAALDGQSDHDKHQAELDAQQARLEASENGLGRQQEELGRQQDVLGKQQEVLGAKQDALGKRQEQAVAQANRQIGQLIDEALAKGAAQTTSTL